MLNDERGVLLEVEGARDGGRALPRAPAAPRRRRWPRSSASRPRRSPTAPGERGFAIVASAAGGEPARAGLARQRRPATTASPSSFDPADRRYRYPFINCTNCGPRFTIVRGVPYDRPLTTMAGFAMCDACRAEYEDPRDRRFHAQPNACPACGPRCGCWRGGAAVRSRGGRRRGRTRPPRRSAAGAIVAVKGIGGYHLACRADDEAAVAALRARKHREDRPFALMAADLARGARAGRARRRRRRRCCAAASGRSCSRRRRPGARRRRRRSRRAARDLGVMLPYSPLHHLLLADAGVPLVMTSGNVSDEPIAYRDEDALERLRRHRRPVPRPRPPDPHAHRRLGRARGRRPARPLLAAPLARLRAGEPRRCRCPRARPLLACGAELKSTFCVAKGARAWVGHHIGDLRELRDAARRSREGIAHFERLFAVAPSVVAHDLHPEYLSTAYALEREGVERVGVQHHHAHLAACLAEHGERGPAVGAIFDGTGYGTDGTVWGGELLVGDLGGFERAGHLRPVRLPGGERGGPRAVADGVRVAGRGGRRPGARRSRGARRRGRRRRAGARSRRSRAAGVAAPLDDERRPAVRRGRRAVRAARRR